MTGWANPDPPTMFAVRVDPAIYPEIDAPDVRDGLAAVLKVSCPRGNVTVILESGGIWRFRGPLPKSTWSNLVFRARWLHAVEQTAKAFLHTLREEAALEAANDCNQAAAGVA